MDTEMQRIIDDIRAENGSDGSNGPIGSDGQQGIPGDPIVSPSLDYYAQMAYPPALVDEMTAMGYVNTPDKRADEQIDSDYNSDPQLRSIVNKIIADNSTLKNNPPKDTHPATLKKGSGKSYSVNGKMERTAVGRKLLTVDELPTGALPADPERDALQKVVDKIISSQPNQNEGKYTGYSSKASAGYSGFSGAKGYAGHPPMFFSPIHTPQTWQIKRSKAEVEESGLDQKLQKFVDGYRNDVLDMEYTGVIPESPLSRYERDVASVAAVVSRRGAVKIGSKDRPASPEDIADMQKQLQSVANDPNTTIVTGHYYDSPNTNGDWFTTVVPTPNTPTKQKIDEAFKRLSVNR